MQPIQCVLQHHVRKHAAITLRFAPAGCRTQWRNRLRVNTFIAGCSHFTPENTRFPAPASSPTQSLENIRVAITLRFAATRAHLCNYYAAICTRSLQNTVREPVTFRNERTRNRLTHELPFIAGCSHYDGKRKVACSASSPKQSPCNIHAAITPRFAATRAHSCSQYNAICIHALQNTMEEPLTHRTERTRTGAGPLSPAAPTLHGKTRGFLLRLPPQHKAHAIFMQSCMTMRFVTRRAHSCSHHNAICIHALQNTMEESITRRHERTRTRTRRTHELPFRAGCSHLARKKTWHGKKHKVSCSGLTSPQQTPCNIHATITLRFAAPRPHSCSHYNAICNCT